MRSLLDRPSGMDPDPGVQGRKLRQASCHWGIPRKKLMTDREYAICLAALIMVCLAILSAVLIAL